ncbi:MAG: glycosyltransferase family 2 protein [Methanobacteriota archaeon]|nr:MAG: glycosyltransferase family 2 protein [Euryarchaeota archaeon]
MQTSICTTNYNCAHALERHLQSVFSQLSGLEFEYIVVDNHSRDGSWEILRKWASRQPAMRVLSRRSTMGEGRQIAFSHSTGGHVMVLDTDVVYGPLFRRFVDAYFARDPNLSVQAIFCGMFPRDQWIRAGGRRSLNTNEDVDLWIRIARQGTMRWYPVFVGENLKEASASGMADYMSKRYSRGERTIRLLRREWDLFKTRDLGRVDLGSLINGNILDLDLGVSPGSWPQQRSTETRIEHFLGLARELKLSIFAQ